MKTLCRPIKQITFSYAADTNRQILVIEASLSRRGSSDSGFTRSVRQRVMGRFANTYTENVGRRRIVYRIEYVVVELVIF